MRIREQHAVLDHLLQNISMTGLIVRFSLCLAMVHEDSFNISNASFDSLFIFIFAVKQIYLVIKSQDPKSEYQGSLNFTTCWLCDNGHITSPLLTHASHLKMYWVHMW